MKDRKIYENFVKTLPSDIEVWIVHGDYIRRAIEGGIEFSNFSHHYRLEFIPEHEFWIDKEHQPDELDFFVRNMVIEYGLMKQGIPFDSAHEVACELETRLREKYKKGYKDPKEEELKPNIWLVDGRMVRDYLDIDFTEGGHWVVYDWMPRGEVWIDDDLSESERKYVIFHETYEMKKMLTGMKYEDAHKKASENELKMRRKKSG